MNLTLQETIILIVAIALLVSIIISIIKASLKIAIVAILAVFLFTGFTVLPDYLSGKIGADELAENYQNKMGEYVPIDTQDAQNTVNSINQKADEAKQYINENKDSWIESAKTLWQKINGTYEEPENTNTEG
jgi:hypothetical protein